MDDSKIRKYILAILLLLIGHTIYLHLELKQIKELTQRTNEYAKEAREYAKEAANSSEDASYFAQEAADKSFGNECGHCP